MFEKIETSVIAAIMKARTIAIAAAALILAGCSSVAVVRDDGKITASGAGSAVLL